MELTHQNTLPHDWTVFEEAAQVADQAVELIKQSAKKAIEQRGVFSIVLAGGTTPEQIYKQLSLEDLDWSKWKFYMGDERCLPVEDDERNSQKAMKTLLDHVPVPVENIYFINSENGAEVAAAEYASVIEDCLPFDMVLLGMGEDGHTASLFPGHEHNEDEFTHAVYDSPKPPSDRISISAKALSSNRELLILVTGAGKKDAVAQWKYGVNLPVTTINSPFKRRVFLDQAAIPEEK